MDEIEAQLKKCRAAARALRSATAETRNKALRSIADALIEQKDELFDANARDMDLLDPTVTSAFKDRLLLNEKRLDLAADGLRQVAALSDPIGRVTEERALENGLELRKVQSPLGVIFMVFESRPNVAIEAFSLALKSGNVILLRGGKESQNTTEVIYRVIASSLEKVGLSTDSFWGISDPDRSIVHRLLKERRWIDIVVPRGGDGLISFVVKNSEIPIIKNDRGLCHVYVDVHANLEQAYAITKNSKVQRPGVCNAMETLLVHEAISNEFIPNLYSQMDPLGVEWFGCELTRKIVGQVHPATEESFNTEYLDLKMNCKVVKSIDEAIAHIEQFGSRHSESIVTLREENARKFQAEVDSAAVYWNAATRFTDGYEFGLGGELGISTQKLHVRGPVGLNELTCARWVIDGKGQIRK